ncbi:MAG TPA: iron-containing alcohol dehydrogenase [Bacilli bacterium]|nr:iron-containing alcohol dehydrogenase [Bacilli bacterium]
MNNFVFHLSTKLYFGDNQEHKVGQIIKEYGFHKVLILGGENSLIKSGLLALVEEKLTENKIKYHIYKGITPNPEIKYVIEALAIAKKEKIDFILAIGGGSVIDVAKVVSVAYFYDGHPLDFNKHLVEPKQALPLGVILTHAAAGSEMSTSAVISDSKNNFKQGFNSPLNRPLFAIENPKYTLTLSPFQTAVGIVDIMMHTLERYFNESTPGLLSDAFAEALLKNVIENANRLNLNPNDYEARSNIMLANSFSHNGITGLGKPQRMPVHLLEHALSAVFPEIAHGAGLAVIFPAWARYYQKLDVAKFAQFARNVFSITGKDSEENGRLAIIELEQFFKKLGLKLHLRDFAVKESDLEKFALIVSQNKKVEIYHYLKPLDFNAILQIYKDCY